MKRLLVITLILALIGTPVVAFASNISGAQYYGIIQISNNSTAATNVATTCNISTQNLIDGNYLNAQANNCVIRTSSGADVPFMPSVNATYPWCLWVPSIGADGYQSDILYTADSTGGEIRYFPADGGMITAASASLKLGDNFTIETKGWVTTTFSDNYSNRNLVYKEDAFKTYISGSGNISSSLAWGVTEISNTVGDTTDAPLKGIEWDSQTFTTGSIETLTDNVTLKMFKTGNPGTLIVGIRATSGGEPIGSDLTSGTRDGNAFSAVSPGEWYTIDLTPYTLAQSTQYAIVARALGGSAPNHIDWRVDTTGTYGGGSRVYSTDNASTWNILATQDLMFEISATIIPNVTATGVSSGNHTVRTMLVSDNMTIWIDGVERDDALVTDNVTDNSNDWVVGGIATPYIEFHKQTTLAGLVQEIEWEYATTFTDLSVNGNDASPTFRNSSSDPDVSAELLSFQPVREAKAPDYVLGEAPPFITPTENITSTFTTTPGTGGFPLAGIIVAVANATGTPPQLPLLIIAIFIILVASLSVSATMRKYGSGSLIVKMFVIVAVMGIFIALRNFGIDFWMLVVFVIIGIALAMASKQVGFS